MRADASGFLYACKETVMVSVVGGNLLTNEYVLYGLCKHSLSSQVWAIWLSLNLAIERLIDGCHSSHS